MRLTTLTCGIILLVQTAFGHAPFDGSARVIVTADTAAASLTVGSSLADTILQGSGVQRKQLTPQGHSTPLPVSLVSNLFELSADASILQARGVEVASDGSEFEFRVVYPLVPCKTLTVRALYTGSLAAPKISPIVATDENGNVFGSAFVSPGKTAVEFQIPASHFPALTSRATEQLETNSSAALPATAQRPPFGIFVKLGIEHILTGYDHLLFLCALLISCRRLKPMLAVITGFTLAHSVTLALAALNLVTISPRIVEPLIAASIIFAAVENFRREETPWHRYALTCGFGLIHGFGFAAALRGAGLAGHGMEIAPPLLAFNLGVEIGQLAVAAVVLPLLFAMRRFPWFALRVRPALSAAVILVATIWLWQRLSGT